MSEIGMNVGVLESGFTVIVVEPDLVGSCTEVAVTETDAPVVTVAAV
jgi:hypothetical protein